MNKTAEQTWRELEVGWGTVCYYLREAVPIIAIWSEQDSKDLIYFRRTFGYAYPKNMAGK